MRTRSIAVASAALMMTAVFATPAQAAPGGHSAAQVNAAVKKGVAFIDSQQNADGSFGSAVPVAETGLALLSYGVVDGGSFANLSAAYQAHVKKAIAWLLSQQDTAAGILKGSWRTSGGDAFYKTYNTGIALSGLAAFPTVNPKGPAAIKAGRAYLTNTFQAPPFVQCSSADGSPTAHFCGGWNYDADGGRSDESNTGFAMTGMHLSGGVPAAIAKVDIGWQHHIQQITSNSFATRNDGGGGYEPGSNSGNFSSNANDTGSMLFSLAFDGVKASDPHVAAGLKFGNEVLTEYELSLPTHNMVYHTGAKEDGTCKIGAAGCDWQFSGSEGGYHYSLFALTKGIGAYVAPSLTDAKNYYAKVVDLLLGQQAANGSWAPDGRDDATPIFASALSVSALGLVAVQTSPSLPVSPSAGAKVGGPLTFTGVVTPPAASTPTPTGSVSWAVTGPDGKSVACASTTALAASAGNTASATCTVTVAQAGSYSAAAKYSGDGNYTSANGAGSSIIAQAVTTTVAILPRTGSSSTPLTLIALGMLTLGLALMGLRRRPRRV